MTDGNDKPRSIHDAIDDLFDKTLDEAEARRLLAKADPAACEDIAKTHRLVNMFKRPVDAPDLTDAILDQVQDEREFVGAGWRRFVRAGRVAVAACLLLGLLGVTVAQRAWPEATQLAPEPRPVSAFLQTTEREAADGVRAIDDTLDAVGQFAFEMSVVADNCQRPADKLSDQRQVIMVMASTSEPARIKTRVTPIHMSGAGVPAFEQDALMTPWPNDGLGAGVAGIHAIGSTRTLRPGAINTWLADPAELRSMHLGAPARAGFGFSGAGLGATGPTFRELP